MPLMIGNVTKSAAAAETVATAAVVRDRPSPPPPPSGTQPLLGTLPAAEVNAGATPPAAARVPAAIDPKDLFGSMPAFPKAFRWLAARWTPDATGAALPLSLRPLSATRGHSSGTGMHAMADKHWLEYDSAAPAQLQNSTSVFAAELGMKQKLFLDTDENPHYDAVFQALDDSQPEQVELLETVIAHVLEHYPDRYTLSDDGEMITIIETGMAFHIEEWKQKRDRAGKPCALLLASQLVQEEFYILKRDGKVDEWTVGDAGAPYKYVFIAGTAAINLIYSGIRGERNEFKLGSAMHQIHAKVPVSTVALGTTVRRPLSAASAAALACHAAGWLELRFVQLHHIVPTGGVPAAPLQGMTEQGWHSRLAHIFSGVEPDLSFYRSNWSVVEHSRNTHYLNQKSLAYATEAELELAFGDPGGNNEDLTDHWAEVFETEPERMSVFTEFQTLKRLPKTQCLIFSIHKYISPMASLPDVPRAADMMYRALSEKSEEQLNYALGKDMEKRRKVMGFLAECSQVGGKTLTELQFPSAAKTLTELQFPSAAAAKI
eukprot:SAG22_NODE_20_length_32168_cov_40.859241_16_plen_546_part_00